MKKKHKYCSPAFTLIEVMIVVVIIAVLAGVVFPNFVRYRRQGNIAKAKSDLRALQTAVESFYIHNSNAYPAEGDFPDTLTDETPKIITSVPTDPFNDENNYGYDRSDNGYYYVIYSVGPDENGSAAVSDAGVVAETNGSSCIYVSNADEDEQP